MPRNGSIEERVAEMGKQMARLLAEFDNKSETLRWKSLIGKHANDPDYDEAMRLGREYRESQRPAVGRRAKGSPKARAGGGTRPARVEHVRQ